MSNHKFFVAMDSDQIHAYVFATNRLQEIRGASALLSELNERDKVECRVKESGGRRLHYAGGGSVKGSFDDECKAKQFILNEQKEYAQKTISATITGVIERTNDEKLEHHFGEVNHRAERKLRRAKEEKRLRLQVQTFPYAHLCESCRLLPAVQRLSRDQDPEERLLCEVCCKKFEAGEPEVLRSFDDFRNWLNNNDYISPRVKPHLQPPKDVDEIGAFANNYIGLIVCDGNRMGEHLKGLEKEDEFERFSDALRETTCNEMYRAVADAFKAELHRANRGTVTLPVELVLIGGDDVVVMVPANKAVVVARQFCAKFQKKIRCVKDVSMSAGVAIAHSHYPLHALHRIAEDLLKSAKKRGVDILKEQGQEANMLDFMVISTPSSDPVSLVREEGFEFNDTNHREYRLYARPYQVAEENAKEDELGKLLSAVQDFKTKGFPRNILNHVFRTMQEARYTKQPMDARYHFLLRRTRMSEETKGVLRSFLKEVYENPEPPHAPWR